MTVTSRTALRHLRGQVLRPPRFAARAWRSGGPERDAVLQAAKAAVAAILAWTVSRWLLRAPQPFLAPYVAVFLVVQSTVWRSVRDAGQQVAVVAAGVGLALLAALVTDLVVVALGPVVLVGLLLGRLGPFGRNGQWVAVTALILVAEQPTTAASAAGFRIVETVVGALVGTVVNLVVFPPIYQRDARRAVASTAGRLADLLATMAARLREDWNAEGARDWLHRARGLVTEAERTRDAVAWARESLRLNPVRRRVGLEPDAYAPAADAVVEVATHVRGLAEATVEASENLVSAREREEGRDDRDERDDGQADDPRDRADTTASLQSPDPLFVVSFADLLDHLSSALVEIREDPEALSPWAARHPPGTAALEAMDQVHRDAAARLPEASGEVRAGWSVESALLRAAQRAVSDLTGRRSGSPRG